MRKKWLILLLSMTVAVIGVRWYALNQVTIGCISVGKLEGMNVSEKTVNVGGHYFKLKKMAYSSFWNEELKPDTDATVAEVNGENIILDGRYGRNGVLNAWFESYLWLILAMGAFIGLSMVDSLGNAKP